MQTNSVIVLVTVLFTFTVSTIIWMWLKAKLSTVPLYLWQRSLIFFLTVSFLYSFDIGLWIVLAGGRTLTPELMYILLGFIILSAVMTFVRYSGFMIYIFRVKRLHKHAKQLRAEGHHQEAARLLTKTGDLISNLELDEGGLIKDLEGIKSYENQR